MPVVPNSDLPAFERLRQEGAAVGPPRPDLGDLHIGLLNLMPDAALAATDRQFIRLVSGYAAQANIHIHPFTLAADHRSGHAREYVSHHYAAFDDIRGGELDALIVTGANPAHFELSDEPFWSDLTEVIDWADESVESVLCSCLATHAVLEHKGALKRSKLEVKRWGVYQHATPAGHSPLLDGVVEPVPSPHSHWFDMTKDDLEAVGVNVLLVSEEAGVHMATSSDGFGYVFFQGHPEYDDISLLKEYKREIGRFVAGERDYPDPPEHYFDASVRPALDQHRRDVRAALESGAEAPALPEGQLLTRGRPAWFEPGRRIYSNWLGEVDRRVNP